MINIRRIQNWNCLEHTYNIKLKEFPSMEIELQVQKHTWQTVFLSIDSSTVSLLQKQKIILENTFASDLHQSDYDLRLSLVNSHLILSLPFYKPGYPIAAVEISFDLKFEIIYYEEKNLTSQKIGIRLFYDEQNSFSFYSGSTAIINMWLLCFSQRLNQKGFHQMFKPSKKLGKGNFASVYEVDRVTDGKKFAVKAFSKQAAFNAKNGKESLINQLSIMRQLNQEIHPNVLKLQCVYESENSIYVVLELLKGGQLFHRIQSCGCIFSAQEVRQFMVGLLKGICHMHTARIMHRDIKPENIMLRQIDSMVPVIVDFGLATIADLQKYLFFRCGTPGYVAPEIICLNQSKHIEPECDIFSAGVIFHILLTRKAVFEGAKYDEVYKKNKEMKIDFSGQKYENLEPEALDLLKRMLVANPTTRISAAEALSHPYLSKNVSIESGEFPSPCLTGVSKKEYIKFSKK